MYTQCVSSRNEVSRHEAFKYPVALSVEGHLRAADANGVDDTVASSGTRLTNRETQAPTPVDPARCCSCLALHSLSLTSAYRSVYSFGSHSAPRRKPVVVYSVQRGSNTVHRYVSYGSLCVAQCRWLEDG
ncbi:hypothetical protein MTO96_006389 [Rhipicephalus appendiculatus]